MSKFTCVVCGENFRTNREDAVVCIGCTDSDAHKMYKMQSQLQTKDKIITQLKANVAELESLVESWADDCQKLKDKYEPTVIQIQDLGEAQNED